MEEAANERRRFASARAGMWRRAPHVVPYVPAAGQFVMGIVVDALSWALILVGGAFGVIGGIGLLRMPDFFTRIHAGSLTDSMCAPCILLGLMLQSGLSLVTVKLAFLILFLLLTSPTATHALAKAAVHGGLEPGKHDAPEKAQA